MLNCMYTISLHGLTFSIIALSHIKTLSNQAKTSSMVPQNPKFSRINHKKNI